MLSRSTDPANYVFEGEQPQGVEYDHKRRSFMRQHCRPNAETEYSRGQQHGDDAPIHAAMRADKLMEAGDMEGKAVWKRILAAIDELLAEKRPDGVGVH